MRRRFLQPEFPSLSTTQVKVSARFQSQPQATTCMKPFLNSPQPPSNAKHKLMAYYVAVTGIWDSVVTEVSPTLTQRGGI